MISNEIIMCELILLVKNIVFDLWCHIFFVSLPCLLVFDGLLNAPRRNMEHPIGQYQEQHLLFGTSILVKLLAHILLL